MINTRFWDDNYTSNLDPIEKLLFLYFLTNTSTNISGVYEINVKKIANETGIDKEMVLKIVDRFTKDGKIFYVDGWIYIRNFVKNQNQRSPKVKIGIQNELKSIPKNIREKIDTLSKGMDTVSKGMDTVSHIIQYNSIKSNSIQSLPATTPGNTSEPVFSQVSELANLAGAASQTHRIAGRIILMKGDVYENKDQFNLAFKRALSPAKQLSGYSLEQIDAAIEFTKKQAEELGFDWTPQTVVKNIARVANGVEKITEDWVTIDPETLASQSLYTPEELEKMREQVRRMSAGA